MPYLVINKAKAAPMNDDDTPETMQFGERFAWGFAVLVPIVAAIYFAIVLPQLSNSEPDNVEWQLPMIIAGGSIIVLTIVGTIVGVILGVIGGTVKKAIVDGIHSGNEPTVTIDESEFSAAWESDIRDREIERYGDRISYAVMASGAIVVIALAMLELEPFCIGNAMFLATVIAAVWGSAAKIRAYRGVFRG